MATLKELQLSNSPLRRLPDFIQLGRLDRPIGIYLLMWPALWALWIAAEGNPSFKLIFIFIAGVVLTRTGGCVINDYADRHFDGHVKRTQGRPLVTGEVSERRAIALFAVLCLVAFFLVLTTNTLTVQLSFVALGVAFCYPFMKRHTHLPQLVLGVAFSWGVPMAFSAQIGTVTPAAWLLFTVAVIWTVVYDTFYAMVDRDDDLKIGVKSTAILFGEMDRWITAALQVIVVIALLLVSDRFHLAWVFDVSIVVVMGLFVYQQHLIADRDRDACFKAFLNNNWVGAAVFVGIAVDRALFGG